jgi:hypothetical protein
MKTFFLSMLLIVSVPFWGSAQLAPCGADAMHKKLLQEHPEVAADEAAMEQETQNFVANWQYFQASRSGPYIIPVVFHIIHQGGEENIPDANIYDQMRILNEDFNKRNADQSQVIPWFQPRIADAGIEFRLANIDPSGNATNGIERINSCQTYMGNDFSKLHTWPREKYLNVWIVYSMMDGVAGYAYYPGSVQNIYSAPSMDGVIILYKHIGSLWPSGYDNSRSLTHEIGHYLNLKHVWGDTNNPGVACGDDDVNDTPITTGSPVGICNLNLRYCNPDSVENVQNYMDYSYCSVMFTHGQGARMIAALNSNRADRNNLYNPANLVATGTDDTFRTASPPVADFATNKRFVCLNGSAKLFDASWNGEVTSYYWEIPNGNPATSTDKDPLVQFLVQGWQPIKLTVTGPAGTSAKTNSMLIYVGSDIASYQAPFAQGFEEASILDNGEWFQANYDQNATGFKYVNYAPHSGSGSLQLNNYFSHGDHDIDEVVSPGFDLTGLSASQLQVWFYYSWASASTDFGDFLPDSLEVLASSNCGSTWTSVYRKGTHQGSSQLLNAGSVSNFFTPTQAEAWWKQVKFNLNPSWKQPNVRFKFRVYSSAHGNNFYLDDLNIGIATTGINDVSSINDITVYPNPTEGDATLTLSLANAGKVSVNILDITGKEVARVYEGTLNDGDTQLPIHGSSLLASGVYIVNVKAGDSIIQKKLIIK